eukprot:TRINITY_DN106068_c0_g1_i1.p1 TRINITY_DN106068_c0_g1~~TRINITY_DN106068_c0_g1_i1.p1  ORF type:complete len:248 (-),score=37.37 TRINITY_DN106068_c0_g1_i1:68-811(-)
MAIQFEFFYDCLSPFGFFAFQVLRRYKKIWGIDLQLRPCVLAGIMAATKNLPPFARPWSAATIKESNQHMARNRQWFNVPHMQPMPANFMGPKGPNDPSGLARDFRFMRMLTAVSKSHPHALEACTDGVYNMIWADPLTRDAQGNVVVSEETLISVCERAGLSTAEAKAAVAAINADSTKSALKKNTENCVSAGGYGVPFFRITNHGQDDQPPEMIAFGSDRFEQLAFAMKKPWLGPDPENPWQAKL